MSTELWNSLLSALADRVPKGTYDSMIRPLHLASFDGRTLVLETSHPYFKKQLTLKHAPLFREVAQELTGAEIEVEFNVSESPPEPAPSAAETQRAASRNDGADAIISGTPSHELLQLSNLNPRYSFKNFVVGSHNKLAHAIATRVAEEPGKAYNPLFIYGGVGLGKTHLMQAIGHHLLSQQKNLRVTYVSSERFTNELINAIKDNSTPEFKTRYRNMDLLLIDDIQFLEGKETTQEEFFHTFNELYEAGKQIVITSDRPPPDLQGLEDRLRSRFQMGLSCDIQPPELETRIAILKKKAETENIEIPDDVLHYIARMFKSNVRELEGAFTRLIAYTSLTNTQPSVSVAQAFLGQGPIKELTTDTIQEATASYYGVSVEDLRGQSRTKNINIARQIAIYLCSELTKLSTPRIGELFGHRDHTTIIYARDKIKDLLTTDKKIQSDVNLLMSRINNS